MECVDKISKAYREFYIKTTFKPEFITIRGDFYELLKKEFKTKENPSLIMDMPIVVYEELPYEFILF